MPPTLKDWYSCRCNHNQDCSSDNLSDTGNGDIPTTKPTINFKKLPKLFKKPKFEKNIQVVQHASQWQSDCNMPQAPFCNGVTDQTHLSGQEYPGLCLVTLVAMKGMLSLLVQWLRRVSTILYSWLCVLRLHWHRSPTWNPNLISWKQQ